MDFMEPGVKVEVNSDTTILNIIHVRGITCHDNNSFADEYRMTFGNDVNGKQTDTKQQNFDGNCSDKSVTNNNNYSNHIYQTSIVQRIFEMLIVVIRVVLVSFNVAYYILRRKKRTTSENILML